MTCVKTAGPVTRQITMVLSYVCLRIFDSGLCFSDTHKDAAPVGQTKSKIYRKTGIYFDINTSCEIISLIVNILTMILFENQAKITNTLF